jgi:uncharacterized membrane protein YhaH (DUF805 family)
MQTTWIFLIQIVLLASPKTRLIKVCLQAPWTRLAQRGTCLLMLLLFAHAFNMWCFYYVATLCGFSRSKVVEDSRGGFLDSSEFDAAFPAAPKVVSNLLAKIIAIRIMIVVVIVFCHYDYDNENNRYNSSNSA